MLKPLCAIAYVCDLFSRIRRLECICFSKVLRTFRLIEGVGDCDCFLSAGLDPLALHAVLLL